MKLVTLLRANFWVIAALALIGDILHSTYTFSNIPLDGDVGRISGPVLWYEDVLRDPFGFIAISQDSHYGGAGRFFCHFSCKWWFDDFHHFLSKFLKNPIERIFINSSSFVFVLQIAFVYLAYLYAKGKDAFSWKMFFPIALLSSVFIQFGHFYDCIGIFDRSINYTFFYAFPILVLAIYFYPFFKWHQSEGNYKVPLFWHLLLIVLAPLLSFSGPLIQPVLFLIIVVYVGLLMSPLKDYRLKMNKPLLAQLFLFLVLSIYAYYVSKYNSEANFSIPLLKRYALMIKGIGRLMTWSLAWPYIIAAFGLSLYLVRKYEVIEWRKLRILLVFVFAFIVAYLFLLPLGGYRSYRPLIVRYDTFLPVTLGVLFLLFYMMYHLFKNLELKVWKWYSLFYLAVVASFFIADRKLQEEANYCQQGYMKQMLMSDSSVVKIPFTCNMLTWSDQDAKDQYQMDMVNKCMRRWGFLREEQILQFTFEE